MHLTPHAERIVTIATALFAEHGYDGVSTREIAAVAGLNIATVNYHVGSKASLYRLVFQRMSELEREQIMALLDKARAQPLSSPADLLTALEQIAAGLVRMTVEHPEIPRLWVRRWLDAPERADIEAEFTVPVYRLFNEYLDHLTTGTRFRFTGTSKELFLKSVPWILYGYTLGGPLDWQTARGEPADPINLAELTRFLTGHFLNHIGESG